MATATACPMCWSSRPARSCLRLDEVSGVPELLTDGENGLVVPPEDPAALAAALERRSAIRPCASGWARRRNTGCATISTTTRASASSKGCSNEEWRARHDASRASFSMSSICWASAIWRAPAASPTALADGWLRRDHGDRRRAGPRVSTVRVSSRSRCRRRRRRPGIFRPGRPRRQSGRRDIQGAPARQAACHAGADAARHRGHRSVSLRPPPDALRTHAAARRDRRADAEAASSSRRCATSCRSACKPGRNEETVDSDRASFRSGDGARRPGFRAARTRLSRWPGDRATRSSIPAWSPRRRLPASRAVRRRRVGRRRRGGRRSWSSATVGGGSVSAPGQPMVPDHRPQPANRDSSSAANGAANGCRFSDSAQDFPACWPAPSVGLAGRLQHRLRCAARRMPLAAGAVYRRRRDRTGVAGAAARSSGWRPSSTRKH